MRENEGGEAEAGVNFREALPSLVDDQADGQQIRDPETFYASFASFCPRQTYLTKLGLKDTADLRGRFQASRLVQSFLTDALGEAYPHLEIEPSAVVDVGPGPGSCSASPPLIARRPNSTRTPTTPRRCSRTNPPRHRGTTRLVEIARSQRGFDRERDALDRRVDRILPDNLLYRVETPHGAVGFRPPARAPIGQRTVATGHGEVTISVWYA